MGKSVLELAVGTGRWDAGLRKAQQALNNFTQSQGGFQQALNKNSEKMANFITLMGKVDSNARTSRGQLNDYKNSFEQLTVAYQKMTDAEKASPVGQAMSKTLDNLKIKIAETKQQMQSLNDEMEGGKENGAIGQMMNGVAGKFGMSASMFTGVGAAIAGIGTAAKLAGDNIRTAMNFERSMSGLSALTGMVGKDLDRLKEYAIDLGSTTTLTASEVADAFRLIGSQQPQLLSSGEALKEVTKYAIQLSEAAGIDLATASQTLSTSINQMGGDSNNAARYVNVLAAASQKGAGDIAWLGEALTKSATAAKAVGTDYEELVANLEQLAKAGFDASTAGTALRSIIMNLEKQANNDFKPSVVGLTNAFENLAKAQLDITGYQSIAGKMFATQAKVLAEAASEARNMAEAITDTNIASEQAQTNTSNLSGSLKSLSSAWEGLNLHINSSNGFLKSTVDWLVEVVRWADQAFTAAGRAKNALADMRGGGETAGGRKVDTRTEREIKEVKSAQQGEGDAAIMKQQQILDQYDRDIAEKQKKLDAANAQVENAAKSGAYTSIQAAKNIATRIGDELEALRTLKQEFQIASDKLFEPAGGAATALPEDVEDVAGSTSSGKTKKAKKITIPKELTETQQNQKEIDALIKEYQDLATAAKTADEVQKTGISERMTAVKEEIAQLQSRNDELKKYADEAKGIAAKEIVMPEIKAKVGFMPDSIRAAQEELSKKLTATNLDGLVKSLQEKLATSEIGTEFYNNLTAQLADAKGLQNLIKTALENGIDMSGVNVESIWKSLLSVDGISDEQLQSVVDYINQYMVDHPITLNMNTGDLAETGKKSADSWKAVSNAVQQVGNALQMIEDPTAKVFGIIAQAVASVAQGFASALASPATTSAGIWGWIAAAAAGTATMVSTIASIKSATKMDFAAGGIVPGNSFNDQLRASDYGISSGELILNRAQQGNIAAQLEGSGWRDANLTATLRGEDLILAIDNTSNRQGRGEYVTSKFN